MYLDFGLRHQQKTLVTPEKSVHVLLQFRDDVSVLADLGFRATSTAGDVAAGSIPVAKLGELRAHPNVVLVEASRSLKDETDLSSVSINLTEVETGSRLVPGMGRGAIIGIIDSGFDLTHPCFSNAQNKTRILAAWEQVQSSDGEGVSPPTFGYGVEYTRDDIDRHLSAGEILVIRNQKNAGAHGTYVAGIAAGNGARHGIYQGIAPEADLILVAYGNDVPVGGSAFVLDAISYIREHARALNLPVVINISQGDNLGAHDGTSLLERAIDNVSKEGGVLVVISAGNERKEGPLSHHARGRVQLRSEFVLPFVLTTTTDYPVDGDTIELWYRQGDFFSVALKAPGGWISSFVLPGSSTVLTFPEGNRAHVYSELKHPTNGDNHIGIILERGSGWEAGSWELVLRGDEINEGAFDVWSDRPNGVTVIGFQEHTSDASTITLPGHARYAVTVGGFVSRSDRASKIPEMKGSLAAASSIGPTRDGRIKPDLTAPSSLIMAPRIRKDTCPPCCDLTAGTSMAAPHVSGLIALLWGMWPKLSANQIRTAIYSAARKDSFTGAKANSSWGYGKLNAAAAYKVLLNSADSGETKMENESVFKFETGPQPRGKGEPTGMSVHIELIDGERVSVKGRSHEGVEYEGTLILRRKDRDEGGDEGGDECWIDGRWVNPCTVGG